MLKDGHEEMYANLGLMPQFDRHYGKLTGRQMLRYYARFSGTYYYPNNNPRHNSSGGVSGDRRKPVLAAGEEDEEAHDALLEEGRGPVDAAQEGRSHTVVVMSNQNCLQGEQKNDRASRVINSRGMKKQPDWGEARINRVLNLIGLSQRDADKLTENYSGGMKRKLGVGLIFITDPEVLILDEM